MTGVDLRCGDCLKILPTLPDASVDAVICDPPYPCIDRPYGRMTEAEWHAMMHIVVPECRRILKPTGSAVFILQPNSRKVGSMRLWLWEFMVWAGNEWNMVQDAWWWNTAAIPEGHSIQGRLMRPSVKACVWLGVSYCYRNQDAVLWDQAELSRSNARCARARLAIRTSQPSGHGMNRSTCDNSAIRRGGVTPFNLLPTTHGHGAAKSVAGSFGHSAGTPMILCDWWTRYISPEGGTVLDPFMGSGTTGLAALARGREFVGIERDAGYFKIASDRIAAALSATPLFPVGAAP